MFYVIFLFLFLLGIAGLYYSTLRLFHFAPSTIADLIAILHRMDEAELSDLLDPLKEENLRDTSGQNHWPNRARLLLEYLRRMGCNALMILHWAYAEQERYQRLMPADAEKGQMIQAILKAGTEFRLYVLLTRARICWWLLRNAMGLPQHQKIAGLRFFGKTDGFDAYRGMTDRACSLSRLYGDDVFTRLQAVLHIGKSQ